MFRRLTGQEQDLVGSGISTIPASRDETHRLALITGN
jgi:hypothetical protein